jgi:hypothetical protein
LLVLFLCFASSTLFAQVKANWPSGTVYANGDSYGYYIDEIPGAESYVWSVQGSPGGATIWPAWDTAIDLTFSTPGGYDVICTVTMSNNTVVVYSLYVDVYAE